MNRLLPVVLGMTSSILLTVNGCRKLPNAGHNSGISNVQVEQNLPSDAIYPPSLVFEMKPSSAPQGAGNVQTYDCVYRSKATTARFRFQFVIGDAIPGQIPVFRAEGKFLSVAGSDDAALLQALKAALEAQDSVRKVTKIPELDFDAVVLGQKQSRDASDGFSDNPPGDWTTTKIFLPKGGDEGQVFFNFNSILGRGEFSIKDSDYGNYVLRELAKVL